MVSDTWYWLKSLSKCFLENIIVRIMLIALDFFAYNYRLDQNWLYDAFLWHVLHD
jgi:hypothetical protein